MAGRSYDEAVDALNTLQTSFKVLDERRKASIRVEEGTIRDMRGWLERIGYSACDLARLNIVHVAGTKGKGSTCAYVDSILSFYRKSHGTPKNIGLYTSPHLVSVRERIRINSTPISAQMFAKYFFEVWDLLESSARTLSLDPAVKPVYFRYLTLMSFHVFLQEGVDAAVYEVGVGGEYDATNVIERPAVTGISTLGIDHVPNLGETIDKIAWHKAGILKTGSPAFRVKQVTEAAKVVTQRAEEKKVDIEVIEIHPALQNVKIQPAANFQRTNASLAIALARTLLCQLYPSFSIPGGTLPKEFVDGLEQVVWRGRCETKIEGNIRWYLDGAHTADSLKVAAQWFGDEGSNFSGTKVLIFNQQGRAEAAELLAGLFSALESQGLVRPDHVVFCTNATFAKTGFKRDFVNHMYDSAAISSLTMQKVFAEKWASLDPKSTITIAASIEEAIDYVRALAKREAGGVIQGFITGSLHLIGGALEVLEGADAVVGS